jgi:hypothetical protein
MDTGRASTASLTCAQNCSVPVMSNSPTTMMMRPAPSCWFRRTARLRGGVSRLPTYALLTATPPWCGAKPSDTDYTSSIDRDDLRCDRSPGRQRIRGGLLGTWEVVRPSGYCRCRPGNGGRDRRDLLCGRLRPVLSRPPGSRGKGRQLGTGGHRRLPSGAASLVGQQRLEAGLLGHVPKGGRSVRDPERHACLTGRVTRPHQGREARRIDETSNRGRRQQRMSGMRRGLRRHMRGMTRNCAGRGCPPR